MNYRELIKNFPLYDFFLMLRPSRFIMKSARNILFPSTVEGFRNGVTIEISSICNARCSFCPYRLNLRKKETMSLADFSSLADKCVKAGIDGFVSFTSFSGEIFTLKNATRYFREAKKAGFRKVAFHTNALAIHKHDMDDILDTVDAMSISFPGFNAAIYKELYQVDRYDEFERSVRKLLEAHSQKRAKTKISFSPRTYLTRSELQNEPFYREFLSGYMAEKITMDAPFRFFDSWAGAIKQSDIPRLKLEPKPCKSIYPLKKPYLCVQLFAVHILLDGRVRLCNCRYDESTMNNDELGIGNLHEYDDLKELFRDNRDRISRLFDDFRHGKLPMLCRKCSLYEPCMPKSLDFQDVRLG